MEQEKSLKDTSNYKIIDGRRYLNNREVSYMLPNDIHEQDRLYQQHWMFKSILQSNYTAPVTDLLEEGTQVLDAGCGPGVWTLDMAENFPYSQFYGIDASDVFPETSLQNLQFIVGNLAKEIPFPDNYFGYVYQRFLTMGLTHQDWDNNLKEIYRILKPGGYVEFVEPNIATIINIGPKYQKFISIANKMMSLRGLSMNNGIDLKERIKRAGFINQNVLIKSINLNHTDTIGELFWDDIKKSNLGVKTVMIHMNPEWQGNGVYENYMDEIAMEAKEYKTCYPFYFYYTQKPY